MFRTEHADAGSEPQPPLGLWRKGRLYLYISGWDGEIDRLKLRRLRREVHALEEGLEAGVGAEGVEFPRGYRTNHRVTPTFTTRDQSKSSNGRVEPINTSEVLGTGSGTTVELTSIGYGW